VSTGPSMLHMVLSFSLVSLLSTEQIKTFRPIQKSFCNWVSVFLILCRSALAWGPEKLFSPWPEPALRSSDGSKPFPKVYLLVARRTLGFDNTDSHTSGIHLTGWGVITNGDLRITCREVLRLIEPYCRWAQMALSVLEPRLERGLDHPPPDHLICMSLGVMLTFLLMRCLICYVHTCALSSSSCAFTFPHCARQGYCLLAHVMDACLNLSSLVRQ
jgi:hypothetical protein